MLRNSIHDVVAPLGLVTTSLFKLVIHKIQHNQASFLTSENPKPLSNIYEFENLKLAWGSKLSIKNHSKMEPLFNFHCDK